MSDYVKATDFAAKDALATGNPSKAVTGTALGTEFDAIASSSATKADKSMASVFLLADGTVSAPGLGFVSDTNTGIYRIGTDNIGITTGGVLRLAVSAAGGVTLSAAVGETELVVAAGSGATSALPNVLLTATAGANAIFCIAGNAATVGTDDFTIIHSSANVASLLNRANANLLIGTNNTTRVTVAAAGNVTIAAPASGVGLTVAGAATTALTLSGDMGAASALNLVNTNGTDGRTCITYTNNLTTSQSWTAGVDPGGGVAKSFVIRDVTRGAFPFTINNLGTHIIAAPAANNPGLTVNGSAATPPNIIGNSSTAFTIDFAKSNVHTVTMTGNVAGGSLTLSNPQDGQTINVFLTQDGTGTRTLGYPAAVKWPSGTAGVLSTPINSVDLLTLTYRTVTGFYYASLTKAYS